MPSEFHHCRHGIVMATILIPVIEAAAQSTGRVRWGMSNIRAAGGRGGGEDEESEMMWEIYCE